MYIGMYLHLFMRKIKQFFFSSQFFLLLFPLPCSLFHFNNFFLFFFLDGPQIQPPRFTTQPSSSGSIVSEGRTKILQCHALGKYIAAVHTILTLYTLLL